MLLTGGVVSSLRYDINRVKIPQKPQKAALWGCWTYRRQKPQIRVQKEMCQSQWESQQNFHSPLTSLLCTQCLDLQNPWPALGLGWKSSAVCAATTTGCCFAGFWHHQSSHATYKSNRKIHPESLSAFTSSVFQHPTVPSLLVCDSRHNSSMNSFQDNVIAPHIRSSLGAFGFPLTQHRLQNVQISVTHLCAPKAQSEWLMVISN